MSLPLLSVFTCADGLQLSDPRELQKITMAKLLCLPDDTNIGAFARKTNIADPLGDTDICKWRDVFCTDGLITALYWHTTHDHNIVEDVFFDNAWLPPTAERVFMQGHKMRSKLIARSLPRCLVTLDFSNCSIRVKLDIENFPCDIEIVRLSGNRLIGKLRLVRLPPKLSLLTLQNSDFSRIIVYNAGLPGCLQRIDLRDNERKLSKVIIDGKVPDKRILLSREF